MHCTLIACPQKHCTLNIVRGRGGGDNSVHVPLHTKALHLDRLSSEALRLEHSLGMSWAGAGGGDKGNHVPLRTKALHLDRLSSEALHLEHSLGQGRGGDKSVHVPLHTTALHLDRLSSEALHLEHSLGQGRGGTTAFMFLCTQKHCTLIVCHLKHCTLNIVLGRRGGRGQRQSCSSAHKSTAP